MSIEDDPTLTLAGHAVPRMPLGMTCAVHRHNSFVPIEEHHIWPKGMGGPDVEANKIKVCCNAHYLIHEYIRQLILRDGVVPWDEAKRFSIKVRELGLRGWTEAGSPVSGGGGE